MSGFPNSGGVSSAAANTFTNSPQTINIPAAGKIGLIVKAFTGQTADLQEWQDSTGTVVAKSTVGGTISAGFFGEVTSTGAYIQPNSADAIYVISRTATNRGLVVKGVAGQSADLQEWQNSAGTVLAAVGANGTIATGTTAGAPTIASAATIAPVTPIAFVSGVITINTITPPAPISTNGGQITLIPTGIFTIGVSGNVAIGSTAVVSKALILTYDPITTKWYPSY